MRSPAKILSFLFSTFLLAGSVFAQTRGEGVGALFTYTQGDTGVSITKVKTAPWSEVIIENGIGEIRAVAKLDDLGRINFTFEVPSADIGNLYIYAVDPAGATNKVLISGTSLDDVILPPTIISEEGGLQEDSIKLTGFGYPGTVINVRLTCDLIGYDQNFSVAAHLTTGAWEVTIDSLVSGSYTAQATAELLGKVSQPSQDLTFEIPSRGIVEEAGKIAELLVATLSSGVSQALQKVTQFIQDLPEPVKQAANTASKAAIPLTFLGILLQAGITTLEDLSLLLNHYFLTLIRIPLFPLLLARRQKKKNWGVLYDSFTKQPIAQGVVRLLDKTGRFVDMEITNAAGAFAFLSGAGDYRLEVLKAGYVFPSQKITGSEDGEYENIYRGEIISVGEKPVVARSVPLDPREIQRGAWIAKIFRKNGPVLNLSFLLGGLILSGVAYLAAPTFYNQLIAGFYTATLSLFAAGVIRIERGWGVVRDETGQSVAAVALSLVEAKSGRLLKRRVTDERGRYQFVVPKGEYKILISSIDWERMDQPGSYSGEPLAVFEETEIVNPNLMVRKKPIGALKRRETV